MEIREFAEITREEMERRTDCEVRVQAVKKNNNVTLHGISIKEPGCNIAPTIYLESYFKDYENGRSLDSIASSIYEMAQADKMDKSIDMEWFRDFGKVRDKVAYKLINYEANRELLKTVPYSKFLDLAKVYYVVIESPDFGMGTILIHNSHLELWGIKPELLVAVAEENTPRQLPVEIGSLCDVMKSLVADDEMLSDCIDSMGDCPMYVASNFKRTFGAAVMCYPYAIKRLAERLESDLFILPSSTHEVLLVLPKEGENATALKSMVYEVNRTQVAAEEVLSDSVYYYSREKDIITVA